ncbi:hypothetical protein D3C86_2004400 [compost metagenome]
MCGRRQQCRVDAGNPRGKCQLVLSVEADHAFAKPLRRSHELADRDGIEKLVGRQEHKTLRQRFETGVPFHLLAMGGQCFRLDLAQAITRFDEMDAGGGIEFGGQAPDDP